MALSTQTGQIKGEPELEEGYEFVIDEEGRRALKKIRNRKEMKEVKEVKEVKLERPKLSRKRSK